MEEKQYQELKSAIQKAVPEIIESTELVKFCAYYQYNKGEEQKDKYFMLDIFGSKTPIPECTLMYPGYKCLTHGKKYIEKKSVDEYRDIRLADVLLAVDKESDIRPIGKEFAAMFEWFGDIAMKWNLSDDNLDHQSDETKQFLYDLLVTNPLIRNKGMTIQTAIEKAIEGGYLKTQVGSLSYIDPEHYYRNREAHFRGNAVNEPFSIHIDSLMVDPQFWQCLGKAMGWKDKVCEITGKVNGVGCGCANGPDGCMSLFTTEWQYRWHRMIDHIADGGTIESYFEKL